MIDPYSSHTSKRVQVYWNTQRSCWSIVALDGPYKGRVISRTTSSVYLRDATFVVQPAGNARVRRERKKNVHAFVRGTLCDFAEYLYPHLYSAVGEDIATEAQVSEAIACDASLDPIAVVYNPYRHTSFVAMGSQKPVSKALVVGLFGPREVNAFGVS